MQAALAQRLNTTGADCCKLRLQLYHAAEIDIAGHLSQLLHALLEALDLQPRGGVAGAQRVDFSVLAAQLNAKRLRLTMSGTGRRVRSSGLQAVAVTARLGLFCFHKFFR
ncbi:MAG: hypothetical protein PHU77_00370 [Simplicispira sp.]|nr:hypothetical protein [Simplicispira sp.]